MTPKLIKNDTDNQAALARIEAIFDAKPGTPEGDELDLLVTLVELYEAKACPIDLPDPIAAIRFRMEQQALKAKDLAPYIGSESKVSEVLAGKRSLSISMIRNLTNSLGLPAEVLIQEPSGQERRTILKTKETNHKKKLSTGPQQRRKKLDKSPAATH